MKKKIIKKILGTIGILVIIAFLCKALPLIRQEKDFLHVVMGIGKLTISDNHLITYNEDENFIYYISKSTYAAEPMETVLKQEEYSLAYQMGSAYIFEDTKEKENRVIVTTRQFSRYYRLWKLPRDMN